MSSFAGAQERQPVYASWSTKRRPTSSDILERSDEDSHHLLVPDEVTAYLSGRKIPDSLGCVDDSAPCESVDEGILRALGFGARIIAKTARKSDQYQVTLEMRLIGRAKQNPLSVRVRHSM